MKYEKNMNISDLGDVLQTETLIS